MILAKGVINDVMSSSRQEYIIILMSGVNMIFETGESRAASPNDNHITGREKVNGAIPNNSADKDLYNSFTAFEFVLSAFSFITAEAGEANTIIPIVERNDS